MTPRKRRRLVLVSAIVLCVAGATALILSAFSESLAYFQSPTDLVTSPPGPERAIRLGGLVAEGSVARDGETLRFAITDTAHTVAVVYQGAVPDLFREGQGVVVEGRLAAGGTFQADTLLAKHDENYMPREAVEALKEAGEWRGGEDEGVQGGGQEGKP